MESTTEFGGVPQLIVGLDSIAAVRSIHGSSEPDPVQAAAIVEAAGANGVAVTLTEERDRVLDRDVRLLKETTKGAFHLTIRAVEAMLAIAQAVKPDDVTLIWDFGVGDRQASEADLQQAIGRLRRESIRVGVHLPEPDLERIKLVAGLGASAVRLDAGVYTDAEDAAAVQRGLEDLQHAAGYAHKLGLRVRSHGDLNIRNCAALFDTRSFAEHEIGYGVMSRAILIGLDAAVRELLGLMRAARPLIPQYRA